MTSNPAGKFSFNGMTLPRIGPVDVPIPITLEAGVEYEVDASQYIDNNWLDFISGVFIDNTEAASGNLIIRCNGTNQKFPFPATYAGYVPLMVTNPVKIYITSTEDGPVTLHFYNVPMFPLLLPGPNTPADNSVDIVSVGGVAVTPGFVAVTGPLTDTELRASPVPVTDATALQGAYTSGGIALSGVSQQLFAANANRRILIIQNNGAANMAVNLAGAAAVLGGAGSIQLLPGGSLILDNYPPTGQINVIGTAAQIMSAYQG